MSSYRHAETGLLSTKSGEPIHSALRARKRGIGRLSVLSLALLALTIVLMPGPRPTGASGTTMVALGNNHTCVLTVGGVECWGYNAFGQVGDGTTTNRATPTGTYGLGSGVATLGSMEEDHGCAVTTDGGVTCWGLNNFGQLGSDTTEVCDGGTTYPCSTTPVKMMALASGITAVTAGTWHTCALTTAGGVKCWGHNFSGQLGDGQSCGMICPTPVDVTGLESGVAAIDAGHLHTCALTTAGAVKCWGTNSNGQLGDGGSCGTGFCAEPVNVTGLSGGVVGISTGVHYACAVLTTGGATCWGYNFYGQLGDGTTTNRLTPVNVASLTSGVMTVVAGSRHTCATTISSVKCWGNNGSGQLGNGTTTNSFTPVDVDGLPSGASMVALGHLHTCAVTVAAGVKCWGYNAFGQLGDGTATSRSTPAGVVGLDPKPTPTETPTITPTITPTPTKQPEPGDTDGDGCSDQRENGPDETQGGQRDYKNPHDFYDVAGSPLPPQNGAPDGVVDLPNDILGVIQHHPAGTLGYDVQFDRGPWTGPNSWNETQGPDGVIDLPNDILGVILQFQHRCA